MKDVPTKTTKKQTIIIRGKDITKEKLTCDLCGKTAQWPEVDIYVGGPFGHLCKDCDKIVCKVIKAHLDMLSHLPFCVVAGTVYKHAFKKEGSTLPAEHPRRKTKRNLP